MTHWRTKTILGKVEVFQSAAHKYSGGMNRAIQCGFLIDEENSKTASTQQARAVQARQSRPYYNYIKAFHCVRCVPFHWLAKYYGVREALIQSLNVVFLCKGLFS